VKIIAGVVGYNDASRFTEDFRLLKGCTPSMFRDRARCTLA
jgi:AraC-like DNA-binding protein